jgi:hypothetical protein
MSEEFLIEIIKIALEIKMKPKKSKSNALMAIFLFAVCNLLICDTIDFKPSDTKKKEKVFKTGIVYEAVSSTPKLDGEIARRKARTSYNIKGMPDYDILEDTMTKAEFFSTKEYERLLPLVIVTK